MSITVIVILATVIGVLVGVKVYFEHKEEQSIKEAVKHDPFEDLHTLVINPIEPQITTPETQTPTLAEIETTNSIPVVVEQKPKKKKRYYPKKKQDAKPKMKNQTKK